jgi:hypothetical protein
MSVSRLSEVSGPATEPMEIPGKTNEEALDRIVSDATRHIPDDNAEPPPRKDLDTLLSENMEKYETARAEEESFKASRESREELQGRNGEQGDIGQTIDQFIGWWQAFKADPQGTGQRFAAAYMTASPYALSPREKKQKAEPYIDDTGRRYNGAVLNEVIDDALRSGDERKEFVATEKQRAALKEMFPGKTFDEALKTIVKIDRDAFADPVAQIATSAGMPVMPHQYEEKREQDLANAMIQRAEANNPALRERAVRQEVAAIMQHPQFRPSGNDAADFERAQHIQQRLAVQNDRIGAWAEAQLKEMPQELATVVLETIHNDPQFKAQAAKNIASHHFGDPAAITGNFELAKGIAIQKIQSLAKAKRVRPVKSSSGALGGDSSDKTLDGAISRAMRSFGH